MYEQSSNTNPRVLRRAGDWAAAEPAILPAFLDKAAFPELAVAALRGMVDMKAKLGEIDCSEVRGWDVSRANSKILSVFNQYRQCNKCVSGC